MKTTNLNASLDMFIAATFAQPNAVQPCCAHGCNACCQEPAYCDVNEVAAMLAILPQDQIEALKLRVIEWMQSTSTVRRTEVQINATAYRKLAITCPMLSPETGLCLAYANRPMGCRTFFATGNPAHCKLPEREHQKFAIFNKETEYQIMRPYFIDCLTNDEKIALDHIGVLLFEALFDKKAPSKSRKEIVAEK